MSTTTTTSTTARAVQHAAGVAAGQARHLHGQLRNIADLYIDLAAGRARLQSMPRVDELDELRALLAAIAERAADAAGVATCDDATRDRYGIPWGRPRDADLDAPAWLATVCAHTRPPDRA